MQVVVGIISRLNGQKQYEYLMSQRQKGKTFAGKWEFPGGKAEHGETQTQALIRELGEELGIKTTEKSFEKMMGIPWNYQDGLEVNLQIYRIKSYVGTPTGIEGQAIAWRKCNNLQDTDLPAASIGILNALRLPDYYAITGRADSKQDFLKRLQKQLKNYSLVQLRCNKTTQAYLQDKAFINELIPLIKASQTKVLININCLPKIKINPQAKVLSDLLTNKLPEGFAGWHLPSWALSILSKSATLDSGYSNNLKSRFNLLISCAVHNRKQIEQANTLGVNFMCLGPVLETPSHPSLKPLEILGLQKFSELCAYAKQPVFAIGGMNQEKKIEIKKLTGQGIAAITDSW